MSKCVVVGIDGLPYDLVQQGTREGWLPGLTRLAQLGVSLPLRPPVFPTTWPSITTFITGKNPGKTGVYGQTMWELSYRAKIINSTHWTGAFWDHIQPPAWSAILGLPLTYPAKPVNGV